jgi:hypothetical protein
MGLDVYANCHRIKKRLDYPEQIELLLKSFCKHVKNNNLAITLNIKEVFKSVNLNSLSLAWVVFEVYNKGSNVRQICKSVQFCSILLPDNRHYTIQDIFDKTG